jgi:exodeoxyribonuclease VIII
MPTYQHDELSNADYHAHSALSRSALLSFSQSPAHFWQRYLSSQNIAKAPTPAMLFGSALHSFVLEPDRYNLDYLELPGGSRASTAARVIQEKAAAEQSTVLPHGTTAKCHAMSKALMGHKAASKALTTAGQNEVSFFATCPKTDLEVKCRADRLTNKGWVIDLKTTICAAPDAFARTIANYQYHIQAGFYLDVIEWATGHRPKGFLFVCIEKEAPYAVSVFRASDAMIQAGSKKAQELLHGLADHFLRFGPEKPWPAYGESITELDLPAWARQ